jgi:hypothetical protein
MSNFGTPGTPGMDLFGMDVRVFVSVSFCCFLCVSVCGCDYLPGVVYGWMVNRVCV